MPDQVIKNAQYYANQLTSNRFSKEEIEHITAKIIESVSIFDLPNLASAFKEFNPNNLTSKQKELIKEIGQDVLEDNPDDSVIKDAVDELKNACS